MICSLLYIITSWVSTSVRDTIDKGSYLYLHIIYIRNTLRVFSSFDNNLIQSDELRTQLLFIAKSRNSIPTIILLQILNFLIENSMLLRIKPTYIFCKSETVFWRSWITFISPQSFQAHRPRNSFYKNSIQYNEVQWLQPYHPHTMLS